MVCECGDNTIQLWSLHTGKKLWKRDVKVPKDYYFQYGPIHPLHVYRVTKHHSVQNEYLDYDDDYLPCPPKSYRSLVFYPTEDLVLPGILSHAYTFEGDLKPLFLSSQCRFWVCSISADKTKMLTDCPNNAKSIIMWSLKDGSEMNRFTWGDYILSFAWSRDGRLLAISDLSGSLTLVDVMDGYRTLAQTTISEACGMIKFSPDCRCLYSLVFNSAGCHLFLLDVNMEHDDNFSLDVLRSEVPYHPWEFESCSETGFLLGDPFCLPSEGGTIQSLKPSHAFVLNEKSVLTVASDDSTIEMLHPDELRNNNAGRSKTVAWRVVLSPSCDTLYVITKTDDSPATLMAWGITSGMFKPGKRVTSFGECFDFNLVAVRKGVLLQTSRKALELWNFELSECIRSWTDSGYIAEVIPISEERVACDVVSACQGQNACEGKSKVIIVDTTREDNVLTIAVDGEFVGCNSKCHVISAAHGELQMKCGDKVFWKISQPFQYLGFPRCKTFSPTEQYYVVTGVESGFDTFYVFDVVSGKILRRLQPRTHNFPLCRLLDCKFVSDEECIICFSDFSNSHFLQLFNVKSGELLSEIAGESKVYSLAACPRERVVAIGFMESKVNFKVLQVKLPGDKHSRKSKRIKPKV